MADRIDRSRLNRKVGRLAEVLGVPHSSGIGEAGLYLDYYAGAGYRVVLVDERQRERLPFGGQRFRAGELWHMIDFAEEVVYFQKQLASKESVPPAAVT